MKNQKKFQKLVKSILIDFIICGIMSTVLSAVSALIKNYYMPIAVNSNYMEDIASGGTGNWEYKNYCPGPGWSY